MPLTTKHTASVIFGASMLLAGCGGQQGSNSLAPAAPMQAVSQPMDDRRQCQNDGGGGDVKVTPCHIRFDANNPGPKDVIVTANRDGGRDRDRDRGHAIKERDNCATRMVATITKDSNHHYTVTAGSAAGSCTAFFRERDDNHGGPGPGDGRGPGGNDAGVLHVVNNI
jgi:hypothetical protein